MTRTHTTCVFAAYATVAGTMLCDAAPRPAWQEDLRRCMVYLPIEGGRIAVANDDGVIEMDVQPSEAGSESTKYRVTFDDRAPIDATAPPSGAGVLDHALGSYVAIAPIFGKAQNMTIAVTPPSGPARTLNVAIGNGAKAMAFLKRCDDYWRRKRSKHH